jgi:SAM-dependent MidA family methyltransferase
MKPSMEPPVPPALLAALRLRAKGRTALSFEDFMSVALYDSALGYYRRDAARIGYAPGSDFLTATVSAPILGRLVIAACTRLLETAEPARFEFVEIGAESGKGILDGIPHPFRAARVVGIGDPLRIAGPSIVFSNELFDAQPFRRFRFRSGAWRELGVALGETGLSEVEMDAGTPLPAFLPGDAQDGYTIDAPMAATALASTIAAQTWSGLFLALDYGKPWEEIAHDTPAGTARAYRRHAQSSDLLAFPGEQDLTCHVCWDWLAGSLAGAGFPSPRVESMEAFFTRHAEVFIKAFTTAEAGRMSRDKLALLQVLHPAHMGQKFQALWALRA